MSDIVARVDRTRFNHAYDTLITTRDFVEFKDYYRLSRERFWRNFCKVQALGLGAGTRTLDIGGGIMAILLSDLLSHDACVGDVNERAADDVRANGLSFTQIDLFRDQDAPPEPFDLVILTEVIEHIPQPPYFVFRRIAKFLKPGGVLFLTTPNGHRFRNILYALAGKEILDIYRYPEAGEALGHQHEYTMKQLLWQLDNGHFDLISSEYCNSGWQGATLPARIARALTSPIDLVPHLRDNLTVTARRR
jgi:SAM-dependent methyltransferase